MKRSRIYSHRSLTAIFTAAAFCFSAAPVTILAAENDYYPQAKESLAQLAEDLSSNFEQSMTILEPYEDSIGATMDISLSINPAISPMLSGMTGFDMSWFQNLSLHVKEKFEDAKIGINYDIQVNDTEICPFNLYADTVNGDSYINAPVLFDGYVKANTEEAMANSGLDGSIPGAGLFTDGFSFSNVKEALPAPSEIHDLINCYGGILIDGASETTSAEEIIEVDGIQTDSTNYTGIYTAASLQEMVNTMNETAKEDTLLKDVLDRYSSLFPGEENLYEKFMASLEDAAEEVPSSEDGTLNFTIWKDKDGNTTGTELSLLSDVESPVSFTYLVPRQDDKRGLFLSISDGIDTFSITGSGTVTDGKLNGTYIMEMSGLDMIQIDVDGYDTEAVKNGSLVGTYTLTPLDMEGSDPQAAAMMAGFTFTLDLDITPGNAYYVLSINSGGVPLVTADICAALSDDTLEIPDLSTLENVYDANDEVSMNGLEATLNLEAIFNNLLSAGVPEEILTAILMGEETIPEEAMAAPDAA